MMTLLKRCTLGPSAQDGSTTIAEGFLRRPYHWLKRDHRPVGSPHVIGMPTTAIEVAPSPGQYIPVLDGLRGVAMLLVFLYHAISVPLEEALKPPTVLADEIVRVMTHVGWTGVDLFFVLSGFLITGILLDTKDQPRWWLNYISRRALRIFPLYFGVLTMLFVILPRLVSWSAVPNFAELQARQGWYWTYSVNLLLAFSHGSRMLRTGHFWSLSVEEQFYLVWPLIVWICSPRTLLRVAALAMVGGLAFRLGLTLHDPVNAGFLIFFLAPGRIDGLMIGAALAVVARSPGGLARLKGVAPWMLGATVLAVGGLVLLKRGFDLQGALVGVVTVSVFALGYGALLVRALTAPPSSPLVRALGSTWLRTGGKISYGFYVFHWPVLGVIQGQTPFFAHGVALLGGSRLPSVLLVAAIGMALSYGLAWISYHYYEKRFLELKRFFEHPRVATIPPGRAVSAGRHTSAAVRTAEEITVVSARVSGVQSSIPSRD